MPINNILPSHHTRLKTTTHKRTATKPTKGPNIRLVGEDAMLDTLESQPLDGHLPPGGLVLLLVVVQQLGQSEVCDLDAVRGLDQDIAGSQVSVHQPSALQISHASGDLSAPVQERLGPDLWQGRRHIRFSDLFFFLCV